MYKSHRQLFVILYPNAWPGVWTQLPFKLTEIPKEQLFIFNNSSKWAYGSHKEYPRRQVILRIFKQMRQAMAPNPLKDKKERMSLVSPFLPKVEDHDPLFFVLESELMTLHLPDRCLTHWAKSLAPGPWLLRPGKLLLSRPSLVIWACQHPSSGQHRGYL